MHICCVYIREDLTGEINKYKIKGNKIPLGISYISSSLKQAGYTTEIIYCNPFKGTKLYKYKDKIVSYNKAKLMDKLRYNILEYVLYYKIYGIKKFLNFYVKKLEKKYME